MKNLISSALATLAVAAAATAETATPSLKAAAAIATPSGTYFPSESLQLTDDVLDEVEAAIQNKSVSDLFKFGDAQVDSAVSKRSSRSCKTLPGDWLWPSNWVWEIFDSLLGRRLIKASPLASVCYPDWPGYDAERCDEITAQWATSDLQYVPCSNKVK